MSMATNSVFAYILHSRPYQESSQIIQLFSLEYGRFSMIAKGIQKRRAQARKAILQPFKELQIEFTGKSDLKTLLQCEPRSFEKLGGAFFQGESLACAYYANELLLRALPDNQEFDELYEAYARLLSQLKEAGNFFSVLRRFEMTLLKSVGIAPDLSYDIAGDPVQADESYIFLPQKGFSLVINSVEKVADRIPGRVILGLGSDHEGVVEEGAADEQNANDEMLSDRESHYLARKLTRNLLQEVVGSRPLQSRRLWHQLKFNEKKEK